MSTLSTVFQSVNIGLKMIVKKGEPALKFYILLDSK